MKHYVHTKTYHVITGPVSDTTSHAKLAAILRPDNANSNFLCTAKIIIIIIIKCIFIAQNRVMQLMRSIDSHTANKNVFSLCLNVSTEMSGARRSAGRLFHV